MIKRGLALFLGFHVLVYMLLFTFIYYEDIELEELLTNPKVSRLVGWLVRRSVGWLACIVATEPPTLSVGLPLGLPPPHVAASSTHATTE